MRGELEIVSTLRGKYVKETRPVGLLDLIEAHHSFRM
jgi:hypothetical protein